MVLTDFLVPLLPEPQNCLCPVPDGIEPGHDEYTKQKRKTKSVEKIAHITQGMHLTLKTAASLAR